ncbi:hypothetical protein CTAYLR_007619 [Chrysophaeum taylorii]|uniref:MYND-type domain-containing protein n=1 Tax=Chrysophaeum taylorii TaxID=2483200 RepID=A0AAD7XF85_9STRA|nr:hypothetical protein CTAYLR_007619 [Chrysophaeum taylorii]
MASEACGVCGAEATTRCKRCKKPYCSHGCRLKDWVQMGHRQSCRRLAGLGPSLAAAADCSSVAPSSSRLGCGCNLPDCEECRIARAMEAAAAEKATDKITILKRRYGCEPYDERVVIGDMSNGTSWLLDDGRWIPKADEGIFWDWSDPARRKQRVPPDEDEKEKEVKTTTTSKARRTIAARDAPRSQFQKHRERVVRQRVKLASALSLPSKKKLREHGGLLAFVIRGDRALAPIRRSIVQNHDRLKRAIERRRRLRRTFRAAVWCFVFAYEVQVLAAHTRLGEDDDDDDELSPSLRASVMDSWRGDFLLREKTESEAAKHKAETEAFARQEKAVAQAKEALWSRGEMQELERLRGAREWTPEERHAAEMLETKLAIEIEQAMTRLKVQAKAASEVSRYENFQRMLRDRDLEVEANRDKVRAHLQRVVEPLRGAAGSAMKLRARLLRAKHYVDSELSPTRRSSEPTIKPVDDETRLPRAQSATSISSTTSDPANTLNEARTAADDDATLLPLIEPPGSKRRLLDDRVFDEGHRRRLCGRSFSTDVSPIATPLDGALPV